MVIRELFIAAFGRLENERFCFDSSLNCIIKKNGYGKTTLLTFIKAMLYGLEDGKRSVTENERKRYLPWRGGNASGYMTVELDSGTFRIERSFGKRSSEDTFKVYDLSTGRLTDRFSERIGEDILEIDKDGFERTVFLSEKLLSGKIENDTVSGKLGGLVGVRYDIGEYENAVELIDESRKRYIKRGGGGEIAEIKAEIFEQESRLKALSEKSAVYNDNASKIEKIRRSLKELEAERAELHRLKEKKDADARLSAEIERFAALKSELTLKEERLKKIDARLGENPPTIDEVLRQRSLLLEGEASRSEDSACSNQKSYFKRVPSEEEITLHERLLCDAEIKAKKAPLGILLTLLAALAVFALLSVLVSPYLLILAALDVCIGIAIIARNGRKRKSLYAKSENKCREFLLEIYENPDFSLGLSSLLSLSRIDLRNERTQLSLRKLDEEERLIRRAAFERAKAYFDSFGLNPAELTELINERTLLLMDIKSHREILDRTMPKQAASLGETLLRINPEEKIRDAYERSSAYERELSRLLLENERLSAELALQEQIKDTLEERRERLAFCEERVRVLDLTKELMVKAKGDMTARYLEGTKTAFLGYLRALSEDGEFTLDTSFDIKKYDVGASREREAYSKGSRELYSFALRLALIDTLYQKDKPPIIIDDAFMSLDDEHFSAVGKLLHKLSKSRQIIYLTCAEARGI